MCAAPGYFAGPGAISPDIEHRLRWASWMLSLPVVLFSRQPFFRSARRDLRQRRIGMDLPVAIGIGVTFAISAAATFGPQGWWGHAVTADGWFFVRAVAMVFDRYLQADRNRAEFSRII